MSKRQPGDPALPRGVAQLVASDTVRGVRMESISADDELSRVIDRLALRRPRPDHVAP